MSIGSAVRECEELDGIARCRTMESAGESPTLPYPTLSSHTYIHHNKLAQRILYFTKTCFSSSFIRIYACIYVRMYVCIYKDMCILVYVCMYVCMYVQYVCVLLTRLIGMYILYLLNIDDINYTIKTLSLCMQACDDSIQLRYVYDST